MEILKGGPVAKSITEDLIQRIEKLPRKPKLCIFRATNDEGAISYETGAMKRMEKVGIDCETISLPENITEEEFIDAFQKCNKNPLVDGILILKPLPKGINENKINALLDPDKDVDCVTAENRLRLLEGRPGIRPCTPEAVIRLLEYYGVELFGKNVTVIGRSMVVGKPLSLLFLEKNATVTICHSKTTDLAAVCKRADILVTAIGRAEMVDATYVKEGAVVADVGINVNTEGKLTGDVNFSSVEGVASMATPVPGGIGNVTTSVLASHVVEGCERKVYGQENH